MATLIDPAAESYALAHTTPFAGAVAAAADWTQRHATWPGMMSGLAEARLLEALIVAGGARRVLEIGTFTAVGTLTMAAAVGDGGRVVTLERDADTAAIARRHLAASPHGDRVELIEGDALDSIASLEGPLDLVYIDAMKAQYPAYLDAVLPKLAPRGVVVADNLFRNGAVLDPAAGEEGIRAMRAFAEQVQRDERLHNALLTIGDGVLLAWWAPEERS